MQLNQREQPFAPDGGMEMGRNIKVSIIVPVYNVRNYLERCVESALSQTLEETEIILVDDCSTDGSSELVRKYDKKYEKIKCVFLSENHGLGGARNAGLEAAEGEYVNFVDSDDWIEPDMCSDLYGTALRDCSDIVYGLYRTVSEKGRITGIRSCCFPEQLQAPDRHTAKSLVMLNLHFAWGRIIRRSLLVKNHLLFPEHMFFEDVAISPIIPMYASNISVVEKPYYNYFQRHESISGSYTPKKATDEIKSSRLFIRECKDRGLFDRYRDAVVLKYFMTICYYPMQRMGSLPEDEQNQLKKKIEDYVKCYLPELCQNPYLEIYTDSKTYIEMTGDSLPGIKSAAEKKFVEYLKNAGRTAVWGAGEKGMSFAKKYTEAAKGNIKYLVDKKQSLWGTVLETGQEIVNFYEHTDEIDTIIIANRNHYYDVLGELKEHGIKKKIVNYETVLMKL